MLLRYIKKYYRVDQTISQTLWSLFTLHNETVNVWTHLVGKPSSARDFERIGALNHKLVWSHYVA